jgi:enediyne biosynthesis protein E4
LEGTTANRSAIGTEVRVYWNGKKQAQTVSGGSGFCAQNQRRLHFGLGKNPRIEKVEVRWTSGRTQTLDNPVIGQVNKVKEQ